MAELSTNRSLLLSVRLLSSDPARSIQDARLTRMVSSVVCVILTQRMACDRDECAFSCNKSAGPFSLTQWQTYLGCRRRSVDVGLIIQLLELL